MTVLGAASPALEPLLRTAGERDRPWLRKVFHSRSAYAAYSALDTELFVRGQYTAGAVLLASVARREGRTTMSLILGSFTAALDATRRVLLIDADVDHGRLGEILGLAPTALGLSELFAGAATTNDCIHPTALPNLWVTPLAGAGNNSARLSPVQFQQFISEARQRFDLIVIDSPAGGENRTVLSLASIVKNVFLVIKYAGPTREQASFLLENLRRVDAEIIGCILNQRELVIPRFLYGAF